ncbi:hypothetical protein [Microlunatus antarcticus]
MARYVELHSDEEYRTVASDAVGDRRVITAWLGIDHGPLGESDRPLIFGTVALEPNGQLWQGRELLAATEPEALEHHQTVRQGLVHQKHQADRRPRAEP